MPTLSFATSARRRATTGGLKLSFPVIALAVQCFRLLHSRGTPGSGHPTARKLLSHAGGAWYYWQPTAVSRLFSPRRGQWTDGVVADSCEPTLNVFGSRMLKRPEPSSL